MATPGHLVFCIALVFSSLPARAAPTADMLELARKEFEVAQTEFNLGHYEQALEHFENSYRLAQKPALLFNLAYVNAQLYGRTRQLSHLDLAIDRFKAFLDSSVNDADPKTVGLREKATRFMDMSIKERAKERAKRAAGEESLTVGEELLAKGQLDEAEAQLARYERTPGNERSGVARAHRLRGSILVARGNHDEAVQAYARALSLDKSLDPLAMGEKDEEGKKSYETARAQLAGRPPLRVDHAPPGSLKPAAPVELSFQTTSDPTGLVKGIQIHYRAGGGAFSMLPVRPVGKVVLPATFFAALQPGQKVEYYGEVVDGNGAVLQHLGTTVLPFEVSVETQKKAPPVTKRWWFWTVTVGVVAVAALGVGLGVGLNRPERAQQINVDNFGLLHW